MDKTKKIILTDCDGVLLSWEWAFKIWMTSHGYEFNEEGKKSYYLIHHYNDTTTSEILQRVKEFNESAAIGFLPAFRDATYYVTKLYNEHGYQFRIISSLGTNQDAIKLREMNLRKLFGDAIEQVTCIATNESKNKELDIYKNSGLYWIEDKDSNAAYGADIGLRSLLMGHSYNQGFDHPGVIRVKNWEDIYNLITKNQ